MNKPPISVPAESRRPNRICSNCGVELFANYQEAGWNHCTREMKPFGNGCKFDGLFACAGKCQCPANTEMLGEFAASSSLLPVPLSENPHIEQIVHLQERIRELEQERADLHQLDANQFIERVTLRIAELPDRTSPDDWPEAMLVTGEELRDILSAELIRNSLGFLTSRRKHAG